MDRGEEVRSRSSSSPTGPLPRRLLPGGEGGGEDRVSIRQIERPARTRASPGFAGSAWRRPEGPGRRLHRGFVRRRGGLGSTPGVSSLRRPGARPRPRARSSSDPRGRRRLSTGRSSSANTPRSCRRCPGRARPPGWPATTSPSSARSALRESLGLRGPRGPCCWPAIRRDFAGSPRARRGRDASATSAGPGGARRSSTGSASASNSAGSGRSGRRRRRRWLGLVAGPAIYASSGRPAGPDDRSAIGRHPRPVRSGPDADHARRSWPPGPWASGLGWSARPAGIGSRSAPRSQTTWNSGPNARLEGLADAGSPRAGYIARPTDLLEPAELVEVLAVGRPGAVDPGRARTGSASDAAASIRQVRASGSPGSRDPLVRPDVAGHPGRRGRIPDAPDAGRAAPGPG